MKLIFINKINFVKLVKLIILLFISITVAFNSCSLDLPEEGLDYLVPPVINSCYQDGENIIVQFTGDNSEYYFDGYDVFVSETNLYKASVGSYRRVQVLGHASATPSFPLSPEDNNPALTRSITLYQYNQYQIDTGEYSPIPFSSGMYYIMLCSHHRFLGVNEDGASDQVEVNFAK
jgi:hypothetical protein